MSNNDSKSLKLSFKGDKKKKKKVSKPKEALQGLEKYESILPVAEDSSLEGWRRAERTDELLGPLFFLINGDTPRTLLICENALEAIRTEPEVEAVDLESCEPTKVEQILIGIRVAGSSSMNLKTSHNTFLAADKIGRVTASRLAAGPLEEWLPVIRDDGVGFQSSFGKFLTYDHTNHQLRADSETLGFNQAFIVKCQAKFKAEAKRKRIAKEREEKGIGSFLNYDKETEIAQAKKFQSWTSAYKPHSIAKLSTNGTEIKKALEAGQMNELLLDRRAKTKSDRYYFNRTITHLGGANPKVVH